jgi:polysaccharide biosynthesis protein PslH
MDYRPNVDAMLWFTQSVLPHVRRAVPDVKLFIVGQMPHPRLDSLRVDPNITLTGRVDSVQPYLNGVYIAPLRMGSGTRLKLLEAMASGCAIVATPTAAAGLNAQAKDTMRITADPLEMAQAVVQLLQSPAARHELGTRARDKVRQFYDWSVLIPRLLMVYKEIGLG